MKINLLDLFSGIGGFSLGLKQAGFDIQDHYFSEVDKHAIAIYKQQFPEANYVGSVTDIRGADLPRINAITFGSPCQDFSLAGKRKGLKGERSSLIGEAIRLVRELQPEFFIWENVKGVFSSNAGEDFWAVIKAFADIGGYRLEWQLLNTAWFLPQNRERIYLVGRLADGSEQSVFPVSQINSWDDEACSEKKARLERMPARAIVSKRRNDYETETFIKTYKRGNKPGGLHSICPTIESSRPESKNHVIMGAIRGRNPDNPKSRESGLPTQQMLELNDNGTSNTLTSVQKDNVVCYAMGSAKKGRSCLGSSRTPEIGNENESIRRLTEIECERLQGFPDNWTKIGNYDGEIKKVSATQRYKCLGNAVSPPAACAAGISIKRVYQ